jgi:hypothetical protein
MLGVAVVSLILMGITSSPIIFAQNEKYKAKLSGKNEIPPVHSSAKGSASFKSRKDTLKWEINITGLNNATGAQLSVGNKSDIGQQVVDLMKLGNSSNTPLGIMINGQISAADLGGTMQGKSIEDLKSAMSSGNTYLNILSSDHPQGELRGPIKLRTSGNQTTNQTINQTLSTNASQS